MSVIQAIIVGLISGITSFLPVSSSGHIVLFSKFAGINSSISLKYLTIVHIGTLISLILACYPDIIRILYAYIGMIRDLFYNVRILIRNFRHPENGEYHPVITTVYRRMAVMLLVTTAVTGLISPFTRGMAETAVNNLLLCAMGFFATALVLLIASYTETSHRKPSKTRYTDAVLIGVFQGFSLIPGVSRVAMIFSGAGFAGFSRKYKIEYALLTMVPGVIGSLILEGRQSGVTVISDVGTGSVLIGILTAAVVGYFMINLVKRHLGRGERSNLLFAVYGAVIGVLSIIAYFA